MQRSVMNLFSGILDEVLCEGPRQWPPFFGLLTMPYAGVSHDALCSGLQGCPILGPIMMPFSKALCDAFVMMRYCWGSL